MSECASVLSFSYRKGQTTMYDNSCFRHMLQILRKILERDAKEAEIQEIEELVDNIECFLEYHPRVENPPRYSTVVIAADYHLSAMRHISKYDYRNLLIFQFHIVTRQNFYVSISRIIRDTHGMISQPLIFPNQDLIDSILKCKNFNDIKLLFKETKLPATFDTLRAGRNYLTPVKRMPQGVESDKLKFWRLMVASEEFLPLLTVLFHSKNGIYKNFSTKEKDSIKYTLKCAFECHMSLCRVMCIFYSRGIVTQGKGLPWYGLEVIHHQYVEDYLRKYNSGIFTIDDEYVNIIKTVYPDLSYHLLPCVPELLGQPSDTPILRWEIAFTRLPDGSVGTFWGSTAVSV